MSTAPLIALRISLLVAGVFAFVTGLDQALGGFHTLGWLGQPQWFETTNQAAFLVADNHQRFMGGVWTGIGLMLLFAQRDLVRHQDLLKASFAIVFVGGLARFSQMNPDIVFGPDIIVALIVELLGMPLLFVWLTRAVADAGPGQPSKVGS
ncbi:MAG: DUF4345 domain-containing protein [Myxococcota bacterium]